MDRGGDGPIGTDRFVAEAENLLALSSLVELLADPAYLVTKGSDGVFRYIVVNTAFTEAVGRTREEYIGRCPTDLYGADQAADLIEVWTTAAVERNPQNRTVHVDDKIFNSTVNPLPAVSGRNELLVGITRNVTEAVRTEIRLAALFSHTTEGVAVLNEELDVVEVLFGGAEIWGAEPALVIGRSVTTCFHPADRAGMFDAWNGTVDEPARICTFEARSRRANGRWRWSEGVFSNLTHEPAVGGIGLTIRDCHARRMAQDHLAAAEQRFRVLVSNLPDALVGVDANQQIVVWNQAARQMFGYREEELAQLTISTLLPGDTATRLRAFARGRSGAMGSPSAVSASVAAARSDEPAPPDDETGSGSSERVSLPPAEYTANRRDGEEFPVEVGLARVPGEDGFTLMASIRDVTERKAAEAAAAEALRELHLAQDELVRAQKLESVGQLAAGIAHEINTPMQYIGDNVHFLQATVTRLLGVAELAEELTREGATDERLSALGDLIRRAKVPVLAERAPAAADDAIAGVANVSRIVTAMKRFSHPGSDTMEPIDVNEAIRTTMTVCRNEWKYSADIETHFAEDLPVIEGHLGPLNQVLLNMIVNATHAIAERHGEDLGVITITTAAVCDGASIEITIGDNGTGIPPDHVDRVFDHFFTTKEVGRGTGQGLAIAYQVVVTEHNGTINLDSTLGEGTTFTIRLPVRQPD